MEEERLMDKEEVTRKQLDVWRSAIKLFAATYMRDRKGVAWQAGDDRLWKNSPMRQVWVRYYEDVLGGTQDPGGLG